jgi:hypothetical protein
MGKRNVIQSSLREGKGNLFKNNIILISIYLGRPTNKLNSRNCAISIVEHPLSSIYVLKSN